MRPVPAGEAKASRLSTESIAIRPSFVCMIKASSVNGHAHQAQPSASPRRQPSRPSRRRRPSSTSPTTVTRSNTIDAACAEGR